MQGHSWVCEWNLHRTEKIVTNRQIFTANASNLYSYFYYVHWWHTRNRICNWNSYSLYNLRINEIPIGIVILVLKIYLTIKNLYLFTKQYGKDLFNCNLPKQIAIILRFNNHSKIENFQHFCFCKAAKHFWEILCCCNLL